MKEEVDVLLTGATGIVGSHIMYELIHQKRVGTHKGKIVILARSSKNLTAHQRVKSMLTSAYLPDFLWNISIESLLACLQIVELDISQTDLEDVFSKLSPLNNAHLIHSAASTNLSNDQLAYDENYKINYLGTQNLYNATKSFVVKFIYISTAFACGIRSEVVNDDYHSLTNFNFRNPYEEIKLKTEQKLIQNCNDDQIQYQIIRPGVVVGRLINKPLYFLPRYNVIYAFAAFFNSLKQKNINSPINIHVHENAQLHLVSVDYVSKVIIHLYKNNSVTQLNVIPRIGCGIKEVSSLLEVIGYDNWSFVSTKTPAKDKIESIYQTKIENSFGPYISNDQNEFDNSRLLNLLGPFKMPDVIPNFKKLIEFAKAQGFKH